MIGGSSGEEYTFAGQEEWGGFRIMCFFAVSTIRYATTS